MNFAAFQQLREKILRERSVVLDCADTNLYRTLARLSPPPSPPPQSTVHRCHLASEWTDRFGFPQDLSRRALISCGVRDSLALLFRHYATVSATLWVPADNYPVYGELALSAGLQPREFPTLPGPVWPNGSPSAGTEVLLVTNPLKPLGRALAPPDVAALKHWLTASPARRLLIDAVYTFDTRFDAATLELLATDQTILLHSLTKGWLHPRLFGIALVPEQDAAVLTPVFRPQPPPQSNLAHARELMAAHAGMPAAVASHLDISRSRLLAALPVSVSTQTLANSHGYFTPVTARWTELLNRENVLGLPAEVFGSTREDITILSSLTFCVAQ